MKLAAAVTAALTVRYLAHLWFVRFLVVRGMAPADVGELARVTRPVLAGDEVRRRLRPRASVRRVSARSAGSR